jgi:RNA polymerase sigma-70 factor (ECF subfamily)
VTETEQREQLVQLLTHYQRRLFVYLRTLVPRRGDAEEVLQEVNLYIWRHGQEFQPGTDFGAWAYKIAYYQALTFRKRQTRDKLRFSETLVQQLAANAAATADSTDRRQEALEQCLKKLPGTDQDLLRRRYESGAPVQAVAADLGRSVAGVYRALQRIHLALLDCIQRTLRAEARA